MKNKLNPFEEQLKKATENFEVPYDANQWEKLESKLDGQKGGKFSTLGKVAVVAAILSATVLGYYSFQKNETVKNEDIAQTVTQASTNPAEEILNESEAQVEGAELKTTTEVKVESHPALAENTENTPANEKKTEPIVIEVKDDLIIEDQSDIKKPENEATEEPKEVHQEIIDAVTLPFITAKSLTICAGVPLEMNFEDKLENDVIWNLGNGKTETGEFIEYTYLQEGEYTVFAYLASDPNVVSNSLKIKVNPKPNASFTVTERLANGLVPVVEVQVQTEGAKHYSWNFGDGTTATGETTSHTYQAKGDYEISLNVVNKYGCFWPGFQRYTNEVAYNLLAAGSFSPNGDGTNDYWMPKALESGYYEFDLQIFDRNNNLVFSTSDPNQRWNGKVNGTTANSGEFFAWKVTVVEPDKKRFQYGGSIILVY